MLQQIEDAYTYMDPPIAARHFAGVVEIVVTLEYEQRGVEPPMSAD